MEAGEERQYALWKLIFFCHSHPSWEDLLSAFATQTHKDKDLWRKKRKEMQDQQDIQNFWTSFINKTKK